MNATTFKPSNRFSPRTTVADAAVAWEGLNEEQKSLVIVDSGIPYLAGVETLTERAEALVEAASNRFITGLVYNEDGFPLRADYMRLDRESVDAWINRLKVTTQLVSPATQQQPAERMLKTEEVCTCLGISRPTFHRRRKTDEISAPHMENPNRWRLSYIQSLMGINAEE